MNVSLTSKLEQIVMKKVKSGRYLSISEVIREAIRVLEQRDVIEALKLRSLRKEIQAGIKQAESGKLIPGHEAFRSIRNRHSKENI
ncbi:MAG: type II toxin-antitoxin system ParD family antitoxin [Candidatus Omnitrophica bacterium]|nr:type II toxin-antitoxin system ParD family antitoxin [Candidatus Omnitrophota bacterium]